MSAATLVALPYSPWSEKARWALDHHGIEYVEKPYVPMLGEPALRLKLRKMRGRISVPVLLTDGQPCGDSYDIAQYAERHGRGSPLFRRGQEEELAWWNDVSERALAATRAMITLRMADDDAAKKEALAGVIPAPLRKPLGAAALLGVRFLQHKYGVDGDEVQYRARLREALTELRRALLDGRTHLLGGELSYADIAMAVALQGVRPVDSPSLVLGPATRRVWTDLELSGELVDLLEWRDQLYRRHRGRAAG
jgi:glutathione S-transferase